MHTLVLVAHPKPSSLSHAIAQELVQALTAADPAHTAELADLHQEGFDPRFTETDTAVLHKEQALAADVLAEQARLDRADALALVYPVYWWSFPGLLKGWIDRVFTQGWAYDEDAHGRLHKKLGRLHIHLLALGGADQRTYARHGYFGAMKTQIDHGIFGYCGAQVLSSELLLPSDAGYPRSHLNTAHAVAKRITAAHSQTLLTHCQ